MPQGSDLHWDEETDVLIVGLGGAGVCAALEAKQENARVTVLERFTGGGATAISGGEFYAGGGTAIQEEAGVEDDIGAVEMALQIIWFRDIADVVDYFSSLSFSSFVAASNFFLFRDLPDVQGNDGSRP